MTERTAKYLAVADTLKREILNGKYESHERFPSEEALARRFGASRPTVERALRELKREGLLEAAVPDRTSPSPRAMQPARSA